MNIRRVLIVDDEPGCRQDLRTSLAKFPEIQVVAEAEGVTDAITQFHRFKPDLIFLDVQMPKRDGFSLLPELGNELPDVVFTTAYDTFAVKAFEVNAADYLVKPIHPERLETALMRLRSPTKRKIQPIAKDIPIFLYADRLTRVVPPKEITYIEAARNHTVIHLSAHKPMMMLRKISEWERILPEEIFLKLDRSHIINFTKIKDVVHHSRFRSEVRFQHSAEVATFGWAASKQLRKVIHKLCLPPAHKASQ